MEIKKRFGILVNNRNRFITSGVSVFNYHLIKFLKLNNFEVDIITDKECDFDYLSELNVNIFYSLSKKQNNLNIDTNLFNFNDSFSNDYLNQSYNEHSNIFMFKDSLNYEKIINYRNALMMAFENVKYDYLLVSDLESLMTIISFGLHEFIPIINYTHDA